MGLLQRLLVGLLQRLLRLGLMLPGAITDKAENPGSSRPWDDVRIRRREGLLHGVVMGRRYAHNPRQADALAILGTAAARMLDGADGRTCAAIARSSGPEAVRDQLLDAVPLLARNGFVHSDRRIALPLRRAPAPRRFDLWVHVTNDCNLRCPYCYIHKSADHLAPDAATRLLSTIEATAASGRYDVIHARFAGGEPMLRLAAMRDFHKRASAACERHGARFSAAVLTNGTAMTAEAIDWLTSCGVGVSVSMDGLGDTQDRMRPTRHGKGSFPALLRGLESLRAAGITPYILVTVSADNLDDMPALTAFMLERQLPFRYSLARDLQWGAQAFSSDGILTGDALQRVNATFTACYAAIEADMTARIVSGAAFSPSFRATHRFCDLSPWRPIRKACGAGERFLALGHDGKVSPCQAALHEATDVAVPGNDLDTIASQTRPFGTFTRENPNTTCSRCRHAPSCAGGCPLLLHRRDRHIDGRSPYCEVFRHVLPKIVRIGALELVGRSRLADAQRTQP